MGDFFENLAAFLASFFRIANDEARRIRNAFTATIIGAVMIYFTQLIFNSTPVTVVVAFICDAVILWAWFNVRRIVVLFGLGEAAEAIGTITPQKPTNALFDLYLYVALYVIFWVHILCFFAPLMSLRENPLIGFFFLVGGTAYIIMYPKGTSFRKSLVWGIVAILIFMFLQTISLNGWVKLGWMDPYFALRMGSTDRALTEALEADKKASDIKITKRLHEIKIKRDKGEELSDDDKNFLKKQKNRGLLRETLGGIFTPSAEAKTPAVKREPRKCVVVRRPLRFLGGERLVRQSGCVEIMKGGYMTFRFSGIPIAKNGRYKIHFHLMRTTTGRDFLEINAGKGNGAPFIYDKHYASDSPIEIIFFGEGMPGQVKYFYPTDNFLKLSADNNLRVQLDEQPYVEITYWE